ncbi:hypothetical protein OAM98_02615 [Schleiferiaceae bacterium]|jgi:hypothetical protein|nr:hypothetical protein [Schleiferiaceae bacterium]MDC0376677.1 hypothetical protein [Schleiferiaceae bacterium]
MYRNVLLFSIAISFLSSCGDDVTYKQKYIELLENHIQELQREEEQTELNEPIVIDEDQVRRQAEEFYLFLCGDIDNLLDLRLTEKETNEWYILFRVKTSDLDEFGFAIEKNHTFSVTAKEGKLRFEDNTINLGLCD